MISRDEFRPLWYRLVHALGRPPHSDLRLEGLYDETKHMPLAAMQFAVDAWVRGTAEDNVHGRMSRFPVPSDLLKICDAYQRKVRESKPPESKYRKLSTLSERELLEYVQTLERQHQLNYEFGVRHPHSGIMGWLAMDTLLKRAYMSCVAEWERRHGQGSRMPALQEVHHDTVDQKAGSDLSQLLEDIFDSAERDADGEHGQQGGSLFPPDADRPSPGVQG